jgi:hypothetical protein
MGDARWGERALGWFWWAEAPSCREDPDDDGEEAEREGGLPVTWETCDTGSGA